MHLIFDADDTLWENNVLFERAMDDFADWLADPTGDRDTIRRILHDIDTANAVAHGYGTAVFLRSMRETFEAIRSQAAAPADVDAIDRIAARLRAGDIELIPDVSATLAVLGERHDLLLLTKGEAAEQNRKLDLSGLRDQFRVAVIVPEKTPEVYAELAEREGLDSTRTWMIGNSVRSDVLPALAAGLGAVFVPNANTWAFEDAPCPETGDRLRRAARFVDLLDLF